MSTNIKGKRGRSFSSDSYGSDDSSSSGTDSDAGLILWRDTGASILPGKRESIIAPFVQEPTKAHLSDMRKPWIQKHASIRVPSHYSVPLENPTDKRAPYLCVIHGYIRKYEKHFSDQGCTWLQTEKGKLWLEKWKSDFKKVLPGPGQTFHEANLVQKSSKKRNIDTSVHSPKESLVNVDARNHFKALDGLDSSDKNKPCVTGVPTLSCEAALQSDTDSDSEVKILKNPSESEEKKVKKGKKKEEKNKKEGKEKKKKDRKEVGDDKKQKKKKDRDNI